MATGSQFRKSYLFVRPTPTTITPMKELMIHREVMCCRGLLIKKDEKKTMYSGVRLNIMNETLVGTNLMLWNSSVIPIAPIRHLNKRTAKWKGLIFTKSTFKILAIMK